MTRKDSENFERLCNHVRSINWLKRDSEELNRVIGVYAEDNYILHSVVPKISEGDTEGYILIFVKNVAGFDPSFVVYFFISKQYQI